MSGNSVSKYSHHLNQPHLAISGYSKLINYDTDHFDGVQSIHV